MRRDKCARLGPERVVRRERLGSGGVEAGTEKMSLLQRAVKPHTVYDGAAAGIQENRIFFHAHESVIVEIAGHFL